LGVTLLGKTREAVIGLLFSAPGEAFHVREIARRTGFAVPTVARELRLLEAAGVLSSRLAGRQVEFKADPACPLYQELQSIAVKTWGIRGRLAAGLEGLRGIHCAFVFGSFASGGSHPGSDIDLLVIGSIGLSVLADACSRVETDVGRTVSAKLYRPAEWSRKLWEGNEFIASVAAGPKLFVVGDEGALSALGESGAARRKTAAQSSPAHAKGGRKPSPRGSGLPSRRKPAGRT
jgi:predicted nucleotidyltransferase